MFCIMNLEAWGYHIMVIKMSQIQFRVELKTVTPIISVKMLLIDDKQ